MIIPQMHMQTKGIQWPGPAVGSLAIGQVMAKILYSNHITQYWPFNLYWTSSTGIIQQEIIYLQGCVSYLTLATTEKAISYCSSYL